MEETSGTTYEMDLASRISEMLVCWHFRVLLTSLASKIAITMRGGVLKFTLVVDNDTTVHNVHTSTVGPDQVHVSVPIISH